MRRGRFGKPDRLRFFPVQMGRNMVFFTKKQPLLQKWTSHIRSLSVAGAAGKLGLICIFLKNFKKFFKKLSIFRF